MSARHFVVTVEVWDGAAEQDVVSHLTTALQEFILNMENDPSKIVWSVESVTPAY